MGATDPAKAEAGTLRKDFGASIDNNATHGSDAPETAAFELGIFLPRDGAVASATAEGVSSDGRSYDRLVSPLRL